MPRGKKKQGIGKGDRVLVRDVSERSGQPFAESGTVRAVIDGDTLSYRVEVDRTGNPLEVAADAISLDVASLFRRPREAAPAESPEAAPVEEEQAAAPR